jgi:hypothetical protein
MKPEWIRGMMSGQTGAASPRPIVQRRWRGKFSADKCMAALVLPMFLLATALEPGLNAIAQEKVEVQGQLAPDKLLVRVRFEGDYIQVDEFVKRFRAQILRHDIPFLFLLIDRARLEELRKDGRQPDIIDPKDFFQRVVRIESSSDVQVRRLRESGAALVQRAPNHTVMRLSLRQLEALRQDNIQFRTIDEKDLAAHAVNITVPDSASLQLVVSAGVDIFEIRNGIVVGRAFDGQIELLREQGLKVEPASPR